MFFNASTPFFIVFPLPFNAIRCSLTPAYRPSTHSNRHLSPRRHSLTLTHPFLFPLHRILGNSITIFTPFCRLLMPRSRALARPRRSLPPPHCPLTSPCLPLLLLDHPLMSLWWPLTLFRCPIMPSRCLLTHPITLERILLSLLSPPPLPFNASSAPLNAFSPSLNAYPSHFNASPLLFNAFPLSFNASSSLSAASHTTF